ncbi:MAG TPA: helix-turn-helix domain-containing protein [Gemmataceae bacterium]|nr:helix-turn-helix domain-containing protein [Gemmataceae bacterium]
MVQGYYTLEEAARILGMATDELSHMAQHREVRAFADRGTWRFRTQDIEELARRRGVGSSPDLPLGEAPAPKSHDSPTPKAKPEGSEGVFHFALGGESDQVEIGQEIISESASGSRKTGSKGGSKSGGPKSPTPKPGSDSDVRLVADGSDLGFKVQSDSDVKVEGTGGSKPKSSVRKPGPKQDSGVKLVPMDTKSDSDVKIVADSTEDITILGPSSKPGSDSDIKLDSSGSGSDVIQPGSNPDDSFLTEEIDLDAELRKAEESARPKKPHPKAKSRTPEPQKKATGTAPFELNEADLKPAKKKDDSESSSEFDLAIDDSGSSIELDSGELGSKDEEVSLGDVPAGGVTGTSDSGINLQEPADSGISLEQGGDSSDEIEFELSLDAESTPKPAKAAPGVDSSSEFELTLEDSARLAPLEEETPSGEEKDIFETDFEVPALEDESGSQAMALDESDTDLESSDFDLALAEEDAASEEESGSQVVALEDEEEVDEGAATIARPRRTAGRQAESEEPSELAAEDELGAEEVVTAGRRVAAVAAPADWGVFTPVVLLCSVLVMFVLGLMSFELLHGMWGYRQPSNKATSMVVRGISGLFYDSKDLPTD